MDKVAELIKAGKIREIADMRDETDLSGLKLTIDLKRGTDPDKLMAKLFRSTPLLDSQSCNFNILIAGMPRVMGVREILEEWTAWRMDSRAPADLLRHEEEAGEAAPAEGPASASCWTSTGPSRSSGRPRRTPRWCPT